MTDITLTHEPLDLALAGVWRISRGSRTRAENILVRLSWVDPTGRVWAGLGEAAPYAYYGELRGTVTACLDEFALLLGDDPFAIDAILDRIEGRIRHNTGAKAAVDMALHDLWGKILGRPIWQAWGLDGSQGPVTSYSIGIDTPEAMGNRARALAEAGWPLIKLKVGTADDIRCVSAVREAAPSVRLIIDANGAWTPREAISRLHQLAQFGIEFCEQPCASADIAGLRFIRERSDVALIADESCATEEDIAGLVGAVDGINIKLMKCGGLRRARRLIEVARSNHLRVMCGCLIESSLAISAAAQLLPLLDYADLDGNLLLASDPFTGVTATRGKLVLGNGSGLGVTRPLSQTNA
ncbi:MAG: dipeptide epimerase [Chloroflexi bacterium]|nr:dipeptide epimerase [Chloroflexota bacterium]